MDEQEFRLSLRIDITVLEVWIDQGWVSPYSLEGRRQFRDADVARGRLILDLIDRMGVNEAGVDVAMGLLDQVHGLRGTLRDLLAAINAEGDDVRQRIRSRIDRLDDDDRSADRS